MNNAKPSVNLEHLVDLSHDELVALIQSDNLTVADMLQIALVVKDRQAQARTAFREALERTDPTRRPAHKVDKQDQ